MSGRAAGAAWRFSRWLAELRYAPGATPLQYLLPSERLLSVQRIHPVNEVRRLTTAVLAGATAGAGDEVSGLVGPGAAVAAGLATLVLWTGSVIWRWWTHVVTVTDQRIVVVRSGLRTVVDSVTLRSIGDFRLQWTAHGRRHRYADLVLRSHGSHAVALRIPKVWRPEQVVAAIRAVWFGGTADTLYPPEDAADLSRGPGGLGDPADPPVFPPEKPHDRP